MLAIEVGGSSVQAVVIDAAGSYAVVPLDEHRDQAWAFSAPGFVDGDRVRGAHHLGWMDVSVQHELGMAQPPVLGMNDAEASALGEWVIQGQPGGLMLSVVMGTGTGGVLVEQGQVTPIEFGHLPGFGPNLCGGCNTSCLDAQIGGHALPTPLGARDIAYVVSLLGEAIGQIAVRPAVLVLAGGEPGLPGDPGGALPARDDSGGCVANAGRTEVSQSVRVAVRAAADPGAIERLASRNALWRVFTAWHLG